MKNPFASMIDTIDQVLNKATNKAQTPALVAPHHPKKTQPLAPVPVPAENTLTMQPTAVYGEVVQGQWIDATGQKAVALPQIIVRMEEHRRTAEQFVEDKEDVADKAVRYGVKVLMYVGPVVLAFFVAMLIGEQYGKLSQDFWWKPGMYAIAIVTEGTLWGHLLLHHESSGGCYQTALARRP